MSSPTHVPTDRLLGEEAIIQEFLAPLAAGYPGAFELKDDCAALTPTPGHDLVVKTDPIAAGVHFLPDDPPGDIGWKALAVNVSDLASKGAVPLAYLMALSFPEAPTRVWMRDFARGLGEAQAAFGIHLAGGDTDRRLGPVTISITVMGEVPHGRMVRRAAVQPGDYLYVTGTLGAAATGLALLREPQLRTDWDLGRREAEQAVRRYRRPEPRLPLRPALLDHASAAMDISDGLAKDLGRMCRASGCGARVWLDRLPKDAAASAAIRHDPCHWRNVVAAGDDYELLVAVSPKNADAFEAAAAEATRAAREPFCTVRVGEATASPGVELLDGDGRPFPLDRTGWDHF